MKRLLKTDNWHKDWFLVDIVSTSPTMSSLTVNNAFPTDLPQARQRICRFADTDHSAEDRSRKGIMNFVLCAYSNFCELFCTWTHSDHHYDLQKTIRKRLWALRYPAVGRALSWIYITTCKRKINIICQKIIMCHPSLSHKVFWVENWS